LGLVPPDLSRELGSHGSGIKKEQYCSSQETQTKSGTGNTRQMNKHQYSQHMHPYKSSSNEAYQVLCTRKISSLGKINSKLKVVQLHTKIVFKNNYLTNRSGN
jgi:hypothetical protein